MALLGHKDPALHNAAARVGKIMSRKPAPHLSFVGALLPGYAVAYKKCKPRTEKSNLFVWFPPRSTSTFWRHCFYRFGYAGETTQGLNILTASFLFLTVTVHLQKELERSIAQRKKLYTAVQEEKGQDQLGAVPNLKSRSRERGPSMKPERLPRRRTTVAGRNSIKLDPVKTAASNRKKLDSDWLELLAYKMSKKDMPEIFLEHYPAASHFGHVLMHDPSLAVMSLEAM